MSRIAVPARLGDDGTVEHPEHWHGDQWPRHQWRGGHWPRGPFRHRGPFWLRRRPRSGGPLRRDPADRLGGGVAAGVAAWRGFSATAVRIVFVLAALISGGWFVPVYVAGWLLLPAAGADGSIGSRARSDARGIRLAIGLASLLTLVLLALTAFNGGWFVGWVGWLFSAHMSVALLRPLGGVVLVIAAIVLFLGPWWLRIARDLVLERQARVRAEERADIAARVHDSVLQTLALIQRRADQPQQVVALARAQERELRSWLFDGRPPGTIDEAMTLAGGVRLIQQEVEAQHGVAVEVVMVGDCPLDDDLAALLAAAREATVNAVKWSGASVVSIFAEVEPAEVSVFVRDRGQGFDPDAVPADRKGVAQSIRARVARHGGSATIRSTPGEGTEVSLSMKSPTGYKLIRPGQESTAPGPTR